MTIPLGHRVRDRVTGLTGVVTARHVYLFGCVRLSVQPPVAGDGKIPESLGFDEPGLEDLGPAPGLAELVARINAPRTWADPGGPRDDPHSASRPDGR